MEVSGRFATGFSKAELGPNGAPIIATVSEKPRGCQLCTKSVSLGQTVVNWDGGRDEAGEESGTRELI